MAVCVYVSICLSSFSFSHSLQLLLSLITISHCLFVTSVCLSLSARLSLFLYYFCLSNFSVSVYLSVFYLFLSLLYFCLSFRHSPLSDCLISLPAPLSLVSLLVFYLFFTLSSMSVSVLHISYFCLFSFNPLTFLCVLSFLTSQPQTFLINLSRLSLYLYLFLLYMHFSLISLNLSFISRFFPSLFFVCLSSASYAAYLFFSISLPLANLFFSPSTPLPFSPSIPFFLICWNYD